MLKGHVLITGANGFLGSELVKRLLEIKPLDEVIGGVRSVSKYLPIGLKQVVVGDRLSEFDWQPFLSSVSVVVHCAARVHIMNEGASNPIAAFRTINVDGTINLALHAARAGVKRFVFISSIGVNGVETHLIPFSADDVVRPSSPYAISKYEAELRLQTLSKESGMEVVIIRPPLVYGPNAPGNFGLLMRWLKRGVPLPLGAIQNSRSMVAIGNLVDLLLICLTHPAAAGQTFLVSDGEDVSTTDLLRRTAQAMDKKAMLLAVPASVLELGAFLLGKRAVAQRLCGSLQVDIEKTRRLLGWNPPLTLDQGLKKAVEGMKP